MEKLRIIVGGYLGLFPTGGAAWDYIQYPLGLKLLGHDVYYFEDTAMYPSYQKNANKWDDCSDTVEYIKKAMQNVGLENRWAYKDVATQTWFGLPENQITSIFKTADIFINVSSSTFITEEYLKIPVRIMIDTDPMFTQVEFWELMHNKEGDQYRLKTFLSHNYFFTFGLNIHKPGCHIPDLNLKWHTTKKPICTDKWFKKNENHQQSFTSILNWIERPPFQYNNQWWGQKNIIFKKFQSLPQFFPQLNFGLIVNTDQNDKAKADMAELKQIGWKILDPNNVIKDMNEYRDFIQDSAAEFSITKETYIKSNSGWFSGRSACYLAAGRPVVTQDTMWSKYIPEGEGLFACNDLAEAKESISKISAEYQKHSKKAREIAIEYFDSKTILEDLLSKVQSTSATL